MSADEGPEYWNRQTQICAGTEDSFKNNIKVAMSRFNQSGVKRILDEWRMADEAEQDTRQLTRRLETQEETWKIWRQTYGPQQLMGVNDKETALLRVDHRVDRSPVGGVHTFQFMYGCEMDEVNTRAYLQYGYDGDDFIILDKSTLTWTAAKDQAFITKNNWDADKAYNQRIKAYLDNECIEWLKKYVGYGKATLERKDAPEVFLLQKDPSSPVLCQATGFYPSNIMMTWQKNKEDHHEDVEVSTTLPNIDGTFQKTISLKPEEWKNNKEAYSCVVQHVGAAEDIVVTVKDIKSNTGSDNTIAIVVGCLAAVAVLAAIVGLIFWKKSNDALPQTLAETDLHSLFSSLSQSASLPDMVPSSPGNELQLSVVISVECVNVTGREDDGECSPGSDRNRR
ncbi:RLA class I histocompatibility antigen, alpha chain 11/11 [Anabarilius grahami]|uniref:RLA class I histocompatibility antigen, alpha chain 11/11 n=1 Tax=Anabarilius grahami TaxID=495550 RepID=A0A3N0YGW0_ANAGA|nr:RLA class I histocompatibility antigen, alpha chain 11/11 [Anabarilius grahami]